MDTVTKDHPASSLRLSDADRDRAVAELSEHFQAGRLTVEELDDRTGRALQARTTTDLAALFTDLPRRQVPVTSAASAPASPVPFPLARVPAVPIAILAAVALTGLLSGHPGLIVLVPVMVLLTIRRLTGSGWRRRRSYDR